MPYDILTYSRYLQTHAHSRIILPYTLSAFNTTCNWCWDGLEGLGGLESLGGDSSSWELEFENGIFSSSF